MEAFQEVKDRREKKPQQQQQPRYQKRGANRPPKTAAPAGENGDVHMKDEEKPQHQKRERKPRGPKAPAGTEQGEQPAATAAPAKEGATTAAHEEEKKPAGKPHHHGRGKQNKNAVAAAHVPTDEPGFTGAPEEWFDGKLTHTLLSIS